MARRRLAVALVLEGEPALEVDGLRRAVGGDRTRVAPHVTLIPPINVGVEALPEVVELLRSAAASVQPFDLLIGPARTFAPTTPVLYLDISGDVASVEALRAALDVAPLSRPAEHPFVPHMTLGEELEPARIEAALTALADFELLWPIRSVFLLEDRAPGPHRWNPVAEARLGDGRSP